MGMRTKDNDVFLDEKEIHDDFIQASGPGGQNVNKVATAVQLRFNVLHSRSLSEPVRQRLLQMAGNRINKEGQLIINASRYRTQEANKEDAFDRLMTLIREAAKPVRRRKATRPTRASVERRLDYKRRHADKKQRRRFSNRQE